MSEKPGDSRGLAERWADLKRRLRQSYLAGAEDASQRDRRRGLTSEELQEVVPNDLSDLPAVGVPDVYLLRVDASSGRPDDHWCPLCGCLKSGWEDQANPRAEGCRGAQCPCHDWELPER
jgi:hypothetical protein